MISKGGDNVLRHKKFIVSCLILAVFLESNNYVYGIKLQHRQSNDYQCEEEGFHADPVNCNVYYRCVNWGDNSRLSKFKFECGPGTVYSESKGYICVHPRDSERPECNELTNDLDSSLHYDQSINRQTTMSSSSSSWTYGSPLPSTLSPQITTSTLPNGHKKPTKNNYNDNVHPSSNNYPGMASDKPLNNKPHGSSSPSSSVSGSKECQEEGFKPHPKDCNKFIRCVSNGNSYQQYEFTCGEGTVWDPSANACNHAWAVNREGCGNGGSSQNGNYPTESKYDGDNDNRNNQNGYPGQNSDSNNNINDNNNEVNDSENGFNDAASNGQSGHPGSGPGVEENEHEHQEPVDEVPKPPGGLYPPPENPQEPGEENNVPSSPSGYPSQPSYPSQTFPPNEIENSSQPTEASSEMENSSQPIQPTEPSNEMENSSQPIPPTEPSNEMDKPSQPMEPSSGSLGPAGSCSEEGFVSDPNDCHKFYRCVQGEGSSLTKYEFTCGEGTAWDQGLLTCNYESSVSSCKGGLNNEGSKPADNNQPGVSTTVSSDTTQTDIGSNPSQTEESSMTDKNESTTQLTSTDSSDISGASGVGPNQDNGIPPEQAGGYPMPGAPSDASTTIMPSEENTSSDNSSPDTGSSTSTGSTVPDDSQNEISSMTTPESSHASTDMSGSCTEEGFFSDPQDCHKFIRCVSSGKKSFIKYSFTCGEGTAWDQNLQTCNYEASVESCSGQSSKPMNEVDSSTPEAEKPTEKPQTDSSSSEIPESSSSEVPNESTTEVSSVSSSEDTNNSDVTTESEPSSTTPGESTTEVTVSSSEDTNNSDVTTESEPSTTASSETPEETPSYETDQSPDSESPSTTQAIESSSETTTSTENNVDDNSESPSTTQQTEEQTSVSSSSTTTENSNTDNDSSSTTPAGSSESSANENTSSTTPSIKPVSSNNSGKCTEEGFHPNPSNCRKFIRCVGVNKGFIKYDFDCGPGTAWDQSLLTCNYIDQVESCKSNGNPSDSGNEKPTSSDGQKPGDSGDTNKPESNEGNKENTTTENSSVSTTPTSNDSSDCSNKKPNNTIVCNKAGFYPHPTNCAKFYRCVDNGNGFNVYYFDCPPGTNFDPSISVCNYPESIYPARDCSGSSDSGTTPSSVSKPTTQESSSSSTTDSLSSTTQKEEMNTETGGETTTQGGEITTEGGDVTTQGGEITTVGGDVTTQGGEMTTDGGEMTTEGGDVTTQGEEMTTLSGDMTTEGGDVTTQGEEMTTQNGEITTQSGEVTTQGDEGGYITPDDGEITTTKEPGPSTEGVTESSDDMTTTESSDDMPITENPPVPITKPSEETTPGEPEETTKTETSTMATGPLDATPCPIGNLTDEQIVLKCPTGFARHPKHCSLFYQCTTESNMEIKILILRCPDNTTFDEKQIKCLPEEETDEKCTTTKHSERLFRRLAKTSIDPIKVSTASLCPDEGHYPYQNGCSNAFYKCKRDSRNSLQGYLYKCPQDYVYWSVSRRCERANRLPVCSQADYDDNEQINSWQNRTGIPIEDFNLSARMLYI